MLLYGLTQEVVGRMPMPGAFKQGAGCGHLLCISEFVLPPQNTIIYMSEVGAAVEAASTRYLHSNRAAPQRTQRRQHLWSYRPPQCARASLTLITAFPAPS